MKVKQVTLIINPASGQDFPILAVANRFFKKHKIEWTVHVTQKKGEAKQFALQAIADRTELLLVYGGDGTIMEVARAAIGTSTPVGILAGGTANVIAKEFAIPILVDKALEVLLPENNKKITIDTFEMNDTPGMLRTNLGFFSDSVRKAPRSSKDNLGHFAYVWSGLQQIPEANQTKYKLIIDGKKITERGVGLTITNLASTGVLQLSYHPDISPQDGYLDVLVLPTLSMGDVANIATETILNQIPKTLQHYRGKEISVILEDSQKIMIDDEVVSVDQIEIHVIPSSLSLLVHKDYQVKSKS